jgi:hypothetical protein
VKFKMSTSKWLLDIKFEDGVLEIPCLKLLSQTESLFRNLVTFAQCCYLCNSYFTNYILLLDFLIDTPNDLDLLVREGILVNRLGNNNAVTTLVNNTYFICDHELQLL